MEDLPAPTRLVEGFEGVAGFSTAISQPDPAGDELRFRGVSVTEVLSELGYDGVWRWLVEERIDDSPLPEHPDDGRLPGPAPDEAPLRYLQRLVLEQSFVEDPVDRSAAIGQLAGLTGLVASGVGRLLAREWGTDPLPSPGKLDVHAGIVGRLVAASGRTHGDAEVAAFEQVLSLLAEHGTSASTLACRLVSSTGASPRDAVLAGLATIGGPRHGGAAGDVGRALVAFDEAADGEAWVTSWLDNGRRLPGFGHRVYRRTDPRVPILRRVATSLDAPLLDVATAYEDGAVRALAQRRSGRILPANPDLWIPVILDGLGVPFHLGPVVLTAGRMAGWSAHILEQRDQGRLIRPSDHYVGHAARCLPDAPGPR